MASCVTTDAIVEGVHFTRQTFGWADIGHKALAVNLSDLAAMGSAPSWFVCALGLPPDIDDRAVLGMADGMARLARRHGVRLVGGNLTRAAQLSLTITAAGTLSGAPLVRSGVRPGDALFVSGPLGDAAAGLESLQGPAPSTPSLVRAQRRPSPHVAMGQFLGGWASACIDVSDGLVQDVGHLARASEVGFSIDGTAVPVSRALCRWRIDPLPLALHGGEDYVLAFTVRRSKVAAFEAAASSAGFFVARVGEAVRGQGVRVDGKLALGGHRHR